MCAITDVSRLFPTSPKEQFFELWVMNCFFTIIVCVIDLLRIVLALCLVVFLPSGIMYTMLQVLYLLSGHTDEQ